MASISVGFCNLIPSILLCISWIWEVEEGAPWEQGWQKATNAENLMEKKMLALMQAYGNPDVLTVIKINPTGGRETSIKRWWGDYWNQANWCEHKYPAYMLQTNSCLKFVLKINKKSMDPHLPAYFAHRLEEGMFSLAPRPSHQCSKHQFRKSW